MKRLLISKIKGGEVVSSEEASLLPLSSVPLYPLLLLRSFPYLLQYVRRNPFLPSLLSSSFFILSIGFLPPILP